jgi:hypothetical protein
MYVLREEMRFIWSHIIPASINPSQQQYDNNIGMKKQKLMDSKLA